MGQTPKKFEPKIRRSFIVQSELIQSPLEILALQGH